MYATGKLLGLRPSTQLDCKADGKLRELQHVRETELVRDIVPTNEGISRHACEPLDGATYSFALWIFLLEFSNRLSEEG